MLLFVKRKLSLTRNPGMLLALIALSLSAVCVTQPLVQATSTRACVDQFYRTVQCEKLWPAVTRSADPSSPISLRFYAKYVCVTLSSTSKPCVTYDSAELSGYSCCGQSALYKAAGAVGFLAIACEVCGLILACCGVRVTVHNHNTSCLIARRCAVQTIKIKPTTVSLFGGVVYCVAAVAHLSIVCFLVNSGAYHSSEWVLPLSLSSVTSRHVGVGLIANCIAVPFDFFAAAVFFIAPVACGKV